MLLGIPQARWWAACAVVLIYGVFVAWTISRHRSKHRSQRNVPATDNQPATLIAFASQTGFADELARHTAHSLESAGVPVRLAALPDLDQHTLRGYQQAFFVLSTTGEGDAPDHAARFVRQLLPQTLDLQHLRFGVLALGDREYSNYCAFGHRVDQWLRHQGATALFDLIEVDNGDEATLRHWQHQLSVVSNAPDLADWQTPRYERWRLIERRLLNPNSAGDPCFHIALEPVEAEHAQWHAGDIAEIDPQNSSWSPANSAALPHREYSIASIMQERSLNLLVRQMRRPDGELGLGSGWLTQKANVGDEVALRIRINANFHLPNEPRPVILIGNGTGIAGLRALLKARIASDRFENWLIFGERNQDRDFFYRDEIETWRASRQLARLDVVFSRDQAERRYVQHRLLECSEDIRAWIARGAAIYVCGSLAGMAPGVQDALTQILGADILEQLVTEGRYRRDVY